MFLMLLLGVHKTVSTLVYVFAHFNFRAAMPIVPRSYFTALLGSAMIQISLQAGAKRAQFTLVMLQTMHFLAPQIRA